MPNTCKYRRDRGFALVTVLSLMVLLSILVLGMLSLSSIAMRSGSRDEAMTRARANAQLALQLAIGQLQVELGPDQRISAPATLLDDPGDIPHESRKYWTGTYESWADTQETRPAPSFRKWLVTQDPATSSMRMFAKAAPGADDILVYSHDNEQVLVPKIAAPGGSGTGALAWWTSDDNQKAALLPPPEDTDPGADLRALAMSGGNGGFPLINADFTDPANPEGPFIGVDPTTYKNGGAATFGQTSLLTGANSTLAPAAFPHLTTNAGGLLTDVRGGGFKKDLSIFFERDISDIPDTALYTGDGTEGGALNPAATGTKGMTWKELWVFHNLPKRISKGSSQPFTTGGTPPSPQQDFIAALSNPNLPTAQKLSNIFSDPWFRYPWPSHVRYQTVISLWAKRTGPPSDNNYLLYFVVDPIVTVWNPFDIAVSYAGVHNSVKFWHLPYTFEFDPTTTNGTGGPQTAPLAESVGRSNANFLNLQVGEPDDIIMRPGEVIVYSQKRAAGGSGPQTTGAAGAMESARGWNLAEGIGYPIRTRARGSSNNYTQYNLKGNVRVKYSIKPNDLRAYYGQDETLMSFALTMNDFWIFDTGPGATGQYGGGVRIDGQTRQGKEGIKATQYPEVFDKIDDDHTPPLGVLVSDLGLRKQPVMIFNYILKNETDEEELDSNSIYKPSKFLTRLNPKSFLTNFKELTPSELETYPWEIQIRSLTSDYESIVDTSTQGAGYFGPGVTAGTGANRVITHSVPREHPVSLAAYQHSIANGLQVGGPGQSSVSSRILQPSTSFAIGNSLASSVIPMNRTEADMDSGSPLADHSYLANTVLWDDWFLSGISPQTYSSFAATRSHEQVALDFFQSEEGLPTTKYKSDPGGTPPQDLVDSILAATPNDEVALSTSAAHILVDGMFNVNSTSVEAWKSVLGSLRNSPSPAQDGSGVDTTATNDGTTQKGKTPTTGLLTPRNLEIDEQTLEDPQEDSQWIGYRVLEDVDITTLAEAIVEQVKSRGPFLSLSDFVNRRKDADPLLSAEDQEKHAASGAIQAALDDPAAEVNATSISGRKIDFVDSDRPGLAFKEPEKGAANYGSPGYIKQADILTPMAPWISVRSDSFTIRAYGESTNASGETVSAWCEATVRRSPDFVDSSDPRTTLPAALKEVNRTFGRRFLVTSFRWMNPSEIQ